MRRAAWWQPAVAAAMVALLGACQPETTPAAAIAAAGTDRPDWLPEHYTISTRSDRAPEPEDGEIAFRLGPGERASALAGGGIYRVGHQYLYSFEVFVPEDLAGGAGGAGLSLARWQGAGGRPELFSLDLDARRGISFRGRTCVPPSGFGQWQQVYLRLRWATDATGFLELRCGNGQSFSAPLIHLESNIATARGDGGRGAAAERFLFEIGLMLENGRLRQPVELRMRRVAERRLYVIFNLDEAAPPR
ncbi:hypothetical protein HKCCSP123_06835 [Rhodobacterales bacterium HKCCSP123]|nr:hypothetical protein [Rhodobacterales bacterium HKCCSP123]